MRSVTSRNLWGGFFGGVLGVLFFGLITECLLPIGCLIGVVGGYWYQEIWQEIVNSWQQTITLWQKRHNQAKELFQLLMKKPNEFLNKTIEFLESCQTKLEMNLPIREIATLSIHFMDIRNSPIIKWLRAHPMNRAYAIKALGELTVLSIHMLWFIPLCKRWAISSESPEKFLSLMIVVMNIGCLLIVSIIASFRKEETLTDMKFFYQHFHRYMEKNILYNYFYELRAIIGRQIFTVILFITVASYGILSGVMLSTVIFLPVIAFLLIIKSIYQITVRPNHWLCLGVTLAVTTAAALLTKSYLESTVMLWLIALATGCCSGLATEGVRRVIAWDFAKNPRITNYALQPVYDQLDPIGRKFVISIEEVEDWIRQIFSPLRTSI